MAKTQEERKAEEEELAAFGQSKKVRRTGQGLPVLTQQQEEEELSDLEQDTRQRLQLTDTRKTQEDTRTFQDSHQTRQFTTILHKYSTMFISPTETTDTS